MNKKEKFWISAVVAGLAFLVAGCSQGGEKGKEGTNQVAGSASAANASQSQTGKDVQSDTYLGASRKELAATPNTKIQPLDVINAHEGALMSSNEYHEYSKLTSLQKANVKEAREKRVAEMNGKVVEWELPAEDIRKFNEKRDGKPTYSKHEGQYVVLGTVELGTVNNIVGVSLNVKAFIEPKNDAEIRQLENMKQDQIVRIKGTIESTTRGIGGYFATLNPAIIMKSGNGSTVAGKPAKSEYQAQSTAAKEDVGIEAAKRAEASAIAKTNQGSNMSSSNRNAGVSGGCADLDVNTPADYLECTHLKLAEADFALNNSYKQAMSNLSPLQKIALKADEIAWIKSKKSACPGTNKAEQNLCLANMTRERTQYLQSYRPQ